MDYDVDQSRFLTNLEIIAGSIYFNDVVKRMIEFRIGKYYLSNIKIICLQKKNENNSLSLSKYQFEIKLMQILVQAVELTLNKIENNLRDHNCYSRSDKRYVRFSHHFQSLKNSENIEFNLKNYQKILKEDSAMQFDAIEEINKSSVAFYHYAMVSLTDLVQDLINCISFSTNFKFGMILNKKQEKLGLIYSSLSKNLSTLYSKTFESTTSFLHFYIIMNNLNLPI